MFQGLRTQVYYVADLDAAKAWWTALLGVTPYFDQPFYVGFNVGGYELGLSPGGPGEIMAKGSVTYWGVSEIEGAFAKLLEAGASEVQPVMDVGEGIKVAAVLDPQGNVIGVIENPHFSLPAAG